MDFSLSSDAMSQSDFEFYKLETDKKLREMERRRKKTETCHAEWIRDLDDRMLFCGRLTVISIFLSVVAILLSVLT